MTAPATREAGHGYARYKNGGCRCYTCAFEVSEYERRRQEAIAAGTWQPFVDAAPVLAHIRAHATAGVGTRRLAELAGVNRKTITQIYAWRRGHPPSGRVRRRTAELILAVPVDPLAAPSAGAVIDATGSRRRVQGLVAVGWGFQAMATRSGWPRDRWHRVIREDQLLASTARRVRDMYDELSMTPAPPGGAATRARALAHRRRWLPPLAWDDDTIDDPATGPQLGVTAEGEQADEVAVWWVLQGADNAEDLPAAELAVYHRYRRENGLTPHGKDQIIDAYVAARRAGCNRQAIFARLGVPITSIDTIVSRARSAGDPRLAPYPAQYAGWVKEAAA